MKRIKWFVLLLVMTSSVGGFADSCACFSSTVANFFFGPNFSGDNVGFSLIGPGVNVSGGGGTPSDSWLGGNPSFGFAPGSIGGGSAAVEFDEGLFGTLGPYNSNNSVFSTSCCTSVNVGAFTFPTNGKNFTVQLPASICCIGGILVTPTGAVLPLNVSIPSGYLTVVWDFEIVNGVGLYFFDHATFTTVPEPASLALMGTGLVAIFGSLRRRLKL